MAPRKSEAEIPSLITDPIQLAEREAKNALTQFDWAMEKVEEYLAGKAQILKVSVLLSLHRKGMEGIDQYAGNFRPDAVAISGSTHQPVAGHEVPQHVEEMLDYLSANWDSQTAYHLSAYAMWRLNWIHPFADGNGRTSRILSYMVMCAKVGYRIPGANTIPEQIAADKEPYYQALEAADKAFELGQVDVCAMEELLKGYLATQLLDVHRQANGEGAVIARKVAYRSDQVGASRESYVVRTSRAIKRGIIRNIEAHPVTATITIGVLGVAATIIAAFL